MQTTGFTSLTGSQRPRPGRILLLGLLIFLGIGMIVFMIWQPVLAAPTAASANLDQCRNGTFASPVQCIDLGGSLGWVNGNATSTQAHWSEGQSIAYRTKLDGLSSGQHTLQIRYDFTVPGGQHAIDYLTTYTRTETTADACSGSPSPCLNTDPAPNKFPIPVDPVLATCDTPQHVVAADGGVPQVPGEFILYGGTIISAAYVGTHACQGSAVDVDMIITFTLPISTSGNAVLAWGGHIAGEFDWGNGYSAHSISGSPYHTALVSLDGAPTGGQDRQLQGAAVYATNLSTHLQTDGSSQILHPITDTAFINGYQGDIISTIPTITGTLNFFVCSDTIAPFDPPYANGCAHDAGSPSGSVQVSGNGVYQSLPFTPLQNGYYCFRSEFIPDPGSPYPFARDTNTLLIGDTAECILITAPTAVSLVSFSASAPAEQLPLTLAVGGLALLGLLAVISIILKRGVDKSRLG